MSDLSKDAMLQAKQPADRNAFILSRLRNRLFDTSRRNRLLYYKPNSRFVNLSAGSVPILPPERAKLPEGLLTWNAAMAKLAGSMKVLQLNKHLQFADHPYLQTQLNTLRKKAENDEKEYGFSQLQLVIAFLHWYNLKEDTAQPIQSPLLLLPVKLKRSKALKEELFTLEILDNEAIVNPILAHSWKDNFGILLPETVALDKTSMEEFYLALKARIDAAEQGVELQHIHQPDAAALEQTARYTIRQYVKKLRNKDTIPAHLLNAAAISQPAPLPAQPLLWKLDSTNLVLGNFNYKKMSLVSDYNQVSAQGMEHPVFSRLFNNMPKTPAPIITDQSPREWYHVIAADPAQTNAILHGSSAQSYIIQGPPGTGKSQTITNLIADFAARGKSVLFVCEKRAALDVVYHRLQQNKLAELCCYIHDSQADKKAFVRELKTVYDDFLRTKMDLTHITLRRKIALDHLQRQLQLLQAYHEQQRAVHEEAGISTRQLIETLVQLQAHIPAVNPQEAALLPGYKQWLDYGEAIRALGDALEQTGAAPVFAQHPFRHLGNGLMQDAQPLTLMESISSHAKSTIDQIAHIIVRNNIPPEFTGRLADIITLVKNAAVLEPLAASSNLQLVDQSGKAARRFEKVYRKYRQLQKGVKKASALNKHWLQKFSEQEVQQGLRIAARYERSFFKFLSGDWRRLKQQLKKAYNFSAHQLPPAFSEILQQLRDEYDAKEKVQQHQHTIQEQYGIDNITTIYVGLEALRRKLGDGPVTYLLQHPSANELVMQLSKLNNILHQLELQLQQALHGYAEKSLQQVHEELTAISGQAPLLKELLPALQRFAILPPAIQEMLRALPLSPRQAEAAMAHKTLQAVFNSHPGFAATTQSGLQQAVREIAQTYQQLLLLNSDYIRASRRQQFLRRYALANIAAGQLSAEQKQLKKIYAEGRRVLEHEMSKTIRFRSIREMASGESGVVLRDIKPIWLMSPLSVSDSLPLDMHSFDVVIFDEASQIPLEEGIPALFRAPQAIIVGDDKQMPPANFFGNGASDPDDLDLFEGESEADILSEDADSLLAQGSRKLHSTMLSWHYRSRYEALISYSNHAFYGGGLLTIPDRMVQHHHRPEIIVQSPEEGSHTAQRLLQHSISFHYLPNSIYEERSNREEAAYIAQMVKQLLLDQVKDSIGIVAFSQEQQNAIEDAIAALAAEDRAFEAALDMAVNRSEEGQYTGLFVKNLENVQGDERDIIIISICYGHNRQGKMLMNFGPVNRRGGEKRLNVIFSRAKKHMAVISSIKHHHITNEHNDGARYFKRFLHYAEMVSSGRMEAARHILDSLLPPDNTAMRQNTARLSVTMQQVKSALQQAGFTVDEAVGQSSFRCTLAVKRRRDDSQYHLGILMDDEQHYNNDNLIEQYYQRPAILQSFGWKIAHVYAKDWLADPNRVMKMLLEHLQHEH
ncbi:AAA domain-containing protein [uncultured Chitinophaga sp.]|jgi:Superfamily I DNA and RNA helicases and helicase subunits|uniref:AAA domain-containing protein n=1 Tax=uncultured Chitinophaga sp. TaxID=339340 RepID=UPI00263A1B7A|nr:AAA domain-containing protein [uncultured Chitinophaga sp.]